MDPWSKVDYPRLIREASMVVEKLPEVNPPSGRVPGQGLLAAPILESQRRRNRGEIAKKGSVLEGFGGRGKYRPKGGQGVVPGVQGGRATRAPAPLVAPLWSSFGTIEGSFALIFFIGFFLVFLALLIRGKPEIKRQEKTGTGTVVH